jgi:hypothetical protein
MNYPVKNRINITIGLFVLICLPLLFFDPGIRFEERLSGIIWNLGHILLFAAILWLVMTKWSILINLPIVWVLPAALISVILISIPIEIVQGLNGREAGLVDIWRNCLGAAVVIIFRSKGFPDKFRFLKPGSRLIMSGILIVVLYPLFTNSVDVFLMYRSFPNLSDLESPFELTRWTGAALNIKKMDGGNRVLVATFTTDKYSGLSLNSPYADWSDYDIFSFRIFNPNPVIHRMVLRIHDKQHHLSNWRFDDRFNQRFDLLSGWNDFSFDLNRIKTQPKYRNLNLSEIDEFEIFTHRLPAKATFYFDEFLLQKNRSKGIN